LWRTVCYQKVSYNKPPNDPPSFNDFMHVEQLNLGPQNNAK